MRRVFASALLACSLLALQGCSGSSFSIPNPFEPDPPSSVNEVYYAEFPSVPIPKDMQEVPKYTAVVQTPDGAKSGTQVFEGRLDRQSLVSAMIHNMGRQGWQLRAIYRAQRSVLVFEQSSRIAVMAITDSSNLSNVATMEIWVAPRLPDGAAASYSGGGGGYSSGAIGEGSTPAFSVSPTAPTSGGGRVQEQGLAQ